MPAAEPCGDRCGSATLRTIKPDRTGERQLAGSDGLSSPHYSPDGRFIAATTGDRVVLLDADRGTVVRTLPVATGELAWQPLPR